MIIIYLIESIFEVEREKILFREEKKKKKRNENIYCVVVSLCMLWAGS